MPDKGLSMWSRGTGKSQLTGEVTEKRRGRYGDASPGRYCRIEERLNPLRCRGVRRLLGPVSRVPGPICRLPSAVCRPSMLLPSESGNGVNIAFAFAFTVRLDAGVGADAAGAGPLRLEPSEP